MGAVELVADKETRESFDPKIGAGAKTNAAANAHGLIIRAIGDSIAMTPPLIITESQINEMFDKLTLALNDAAAEIHKAKAA